MKYKDLKFGDIVVFFIEDSMFIALVEKGGELTTPDYFKLTDDIEFSYANPDEVRIFMQWFLMTPRVFKPGFNNVDNPAYYASTNIECIDAMEAAYGTEVVMHFCQCNAFKYIFRFPNKNGVEDIKKALWYENKYIELSEKLNK